MGRLESAHLNDLLPKRGLTLGPGPSRHTTQVEVDVLECKCKRRTSTWDSWSTSALVNSVHFDVIRTSFHTSNNGPQLEN